MSNFGFGCLRVVNPYQPAFREARSAIGAAAVLAEAEEYSSLGEAVADCSLVIGTTAVGRRELQHQLKTLEPGMRLIRERLRSGRVAILFGSEKVGLSNDDFSYCHWLVRIPTSEQNISMNLGQAVAVSLYELIREGTIEYGPETPEHATTSEIERITEALMDALSGSRYVRPGSEDFARERVRRLVRRLDLQSRDAKVLLGMLRQIVWKVRSGARSNS